MTLHSAELNHEEPWLEVAVLSTTESSWTNKSAEGCSDEIGLGGLATDGSREDLHKQSVSGWETCTYRQKSLDGVASYNLV